MRQEFDKNDLTVYYVAGHADLSPKNVKRRLKSAKTSEIQYQKTEFQTYIYVWKLTSV